VTVIAGVVRGGRVWIGGDSAGVAGTDLTVRRDPKVFLNGAYLIGFTSSFRMGQALAHRFQPPPPPRRAADLYRFMVVDFVDAAREALKTAGFAQVHDGAEAGGCFLVGVGGRLFQIESDYQVGEARAGFDAVGCGAAYALGSLFTSKGSPERRVRTALLAAERHSGGVRGPFVVLTTT
jgi:ATP-dependent protease HslVU (ClpYQ) peptidase subunit